MPNNIKSTEPRNKFPTWVKWLLLIIIVRALFVYSQPSSDEIIARLNRESSPEYYTLLNRSIETIPTNDTQKVEEIMNNVNNSSSLLGKRKLCDIKRAWYDLCDKNELFGIYQDELDIIAGELITANKEEIKGKISAPLRERNNTDEIIRLAMERVILEQICSDRTVKYIKDTENNIMISCEWKQNTLWNEQDNNSPAIDETELEKLFGAEVGYLMKTRNFDKLKTLAEKGDSMAKTAILFAEDIGTYKAKDKKEVYKLRIEEQLDLVEDQQIRKALEKGDFAYVESIANSGNIDAQRTLGHIYFAGGLFPFYSTQESLKRAIQWYSMASKQGDLYSQRMLEELNGKPSLYP